MHDGHVNSFFFRDLSNGSTGIDPFRHHSGFLDGPLQGLTSGDQSAEGMVSARTGHTGYREISHAREQLGYEPETPLEVGLARFVEWYRTIGPPEPREERA